MEQQTVDISGPFCWRFLRRWHESLLIVPSEASAASKPVSWLTGRVAPAERFVCVVFCVVFAPSPLGDNSHSAASSTAGHHLHLGKFISMAGECVWFISCDLQQTVGSAVSRLAPLGKKSELLGFHALYYFGVGLNRQHVSSLKTSHQHVPFNLFSFI